MLTKLFPTPLWVEDFELAELAHIQSDILKNLVNIQGQTLPAPWGESVSTTWNPNRNTDVDQFLIEGLALGIIKATQGLLKEVGYEGEHLRLKHSWFTWHRRGGWAFEHSTPAARICGLYVYQGTSLRL